MTSVQARLLADMMPHSIAEVLRNLGRINMDGIAGADIDYLKEFRLISRERNLINNEFIWVLTADGKKVRRALG